MKPSEGIAYGLAVISLAGAGFFAYRASDTEARLTFLEKRQAEETKAQEAKTAKDLEVIRAESVSLRAELGKVQEALKVAQGRLTAQGEKPVTPVPEVAEVTKPKKRSGVARMMALSRQEMDNPVAKEEMRKGARQQINTLYAGIFKEMGLEGETKDKVAEALVDRAVGQMGVDALIFDETVKEDDILRQQQEVATKASADLAGVLSGAQLARLEVLDRELPDQRRAAQVDQDLAWLKLQPGLREQVTAVVIEESKVMQAQEARFGILGTDGLPDLSLTMEQIRQARRTLSWEEGSPDMEQAMKDMAQVRERVLIRVQPFLTPEQFKNFKDQEETKARLMGMFLKSRLSIGEGESPPR